jgi:hypothetical protein
MDAAPAWASIKPGGMSKPANSGMPDIARAPPSETANTSTNQKTTSAPRNAGSPRLRVFLPRIKRVRDMRQ